MMDYYQHEQEVANGWDETPTGSNDLIYGIGISMGYYPEVFDLMSGEMSKDDYSNRYVSADHKIKKMTERRKKSRNSYDAMRDIVLSFPNKDMFAEICRKSGIEVELFNEDGRCINRLSDHEPDFIMSKPNLFGKITRNVKVQFTNNPIGTSFLMSEDKFIRLHGHNTTLVIINTNTKQFAVVNMSTLKSDEVKPIYRFGKFMESIKITPKRVPFYSSGNISNLIKNIF